MDVVMLSRIQLGLTTAFHIVFPTLTIGFALFISTVFIWTPYHNPVFYPLGGDIDSSRDPWVHLSQLPGISRQNRLLEKL
jgi:hypothetical protein